MIRLQAYKYRLKTNEAQEGQLKRFAGCCRFVWNKALTLQKQLLDNKEKRLTYNKIALLLPQWKQEHVFLKEVHSQILQQSLMNLDRAIKDAFNKSSPKRFPKFKKKGIHDSFRYPQGFKLNDNVVYLPKVGWIPFYKSRGIVGTIRNVTVSRNGKHWFVSIQTEQEVSDPVHASDSAVGIDMGVKRFATLSDGTIYEPLKSFKKLEKKLAREQRKLSRKVKRSSNWKKQKQKIACIHKRIADTRNDYLHKTSTAISKNHALVVLEDLKVVNMSASAKGTVNNPGRNVRAKSGLNKAILDQGWSGFRRMLEYKMIWAGGRIIVVPPQYTSQECPLCHNISPDNRKTQETFKCISCSYTNNADLVAAINILAAGLAVSACGEAVHQGSSRKQEPARAVA
jgi:putative transposase